MSRPSKSRRRRIRHDLRHARRLQGFHDMLDRRYGPDATADEKLIRFAALLDRRRAILAALLAGHITGREAVSAISAATGKPAMDPLVR